MIKVIIGDSRQMIEVANDSVDLVVTSPPYWHLKDYAIVGQIGYGQSLHEYLKSLYLVWQECYRVLKPGTRLCINTGDQFLRSIVYGKYKIAPLHSEFITQCEQIGFDYMGSIIWQKRTTMNTTGGATVMGSYPYPPNGLIEIDYEFILIFKKEGTRTYERIYREESKLSKDEWKTYFTGHWTFAGEKQIDHEAMFPEELPKRLIKMFTFVNDTVLDPFLGSGTTMKAAGQLYRNCIGYEINDKYLPVIINKTGINTATSATTKTQEIIRRPHPVKIIKPVHYVPNIKDARPVISPEKFNFKEQRLYKVASIVNQRTIELDTGLKVQLIGVETGPDQNELVINYLNKYVKGKEVLVKFDPHCKPENDLIPAYLYLKNKIFINKEIAKLKGTIISQYEFKYKNTFLKCAEAGHGKGMDIKQRNK